MCIVADCDLTTNGSHNDMIKVQSSATVELPSEDRRTDEPDGVAFCCRVGTITRRRLAYESREECTRTKGTGHAAQSDDGSGGDGKSRPCRRRMQWL